MSRKKDWKKGFSLIELLIAVAITAVLSSILILYSATGRAQVALYVEEAKIAQLVLKSKSLAIATYANPGQSTCGYGLHIDYETGRYSVFSYRTSDCSNIFGIDTADPMKYKEIESYSLSSDIVFQSGSSGNLDSVLFVPPDPKTLIWSGGGALTGNFGSIELKTLSGSASAKILVTIGGQITF